MFDPYRKWLGIQPKDQPPNHYRLLSLDLYESDLDVIEGAADRAMGFIRQYQSGEHAALAAKLLNEIAMARLCLLKPASKADYDAKLKKQFAVPETTEVDRLPFEIDTELAQLMREPTLVQAPKPVRKPKRKKSKSLDGLYVTVGIGAVVGLLFLSLLFSFGGGSTTRITSPPGIVEIQRTEISPAPATSKIELVTPKVEMTTPKSPARPKMITLTDLRLVDDPVGLPVDLMEEIKNNANSHYISFPTPVPADYQLRFNVTRSKGDKPFWIGFLMEGRQGLVVFDGWSNDASLLYVDGTEKGGNCSIHQGAVFENEQQSSVILTVHPGHVHASVDGKTIIDWYGESDRLYFPAKDFPANRERSFIAKDANDYQINLAQMVPIKSEPKPARVDRVDANVDLMPLFEIPRDTQKGAWTIKQNALISSDNRAQIQIPVEPPEEYTLSATIERPANAKGDPELSFGLVVGTALCQVVTFDEEGSGLDTISGQRWNKNETHVLGHQLKPGESVNVTLTVTRSGIRYDYDGRTLIDWRGDHQLLGLPHDYYSANGRRLYLASQSKYRFRDLKIGPPLDPPLPTDTPPMVAGSSVDLLKLVDLKRDVLAGEWETSGSGKRVLGSNQVSKLVIPVEVPSEYKLSINAGREGSGIKTDDSLTIVLPTASSTAELTIDAGSSTFCGFHVDGYLATDERNPTSRKHHAIELGKTEEIVVFVRKTGLKVMVGGQEIINWSGNPNRLTRDGDYSSPAGRIAICSRKTQFWIPRLEIEPLPPSSFPSEASFVSDGNLLAIIDPQRDSRGGEWKFEGKSLVSSRIQLPRIRLPGPVPDRYLLTATVERKSGTGELFIGMVIGGNAGAAAIDGGHGKVAGLMRLDGLEFHDVSNPTCRNYKTPLLPAGQRVEVQCFVLPDTVIVNCGGKEVIRWHGDSRRFTLPSISYLPPNYSSEDREHLWLGGWHSAFAIHELELKPLSDDEAKKITGSFTGVFPLSSQANVPLRDVGSKSE